MTLGMDLDAILDQALDEFEGTSFLFLITLMAADT